MKKKDNLFPDLFLRYFILIIIAVPNFWLFYALFTPLTASVTNFFLNSFYGTMFSGNIIQINPGLSIEIIDACVAGSAYYLLFILNLSIKNLNLSKRIKMVVYSFAALFAINVLRIVVLSVLLVHEIAWFDMAHKLFWYLGSIVLVIVIWFVEVKYFKIKEVPFVEDIKSLYKKGK